MKIDLNIGYTPIPYMSIVVLINQCNFLLSQYQPTP